MNSIKIGQKLQFPDGDYAKVTRTEFYEDEEDIKGTYNSLVVFFVIDGDEDKQEFSEILDSRENYKFNIMKLINE